MKAYEHLEASFGLHYCFWLHINVMLQLGQQIALVNNLEQLWRTDSDSSDEYSVGNTEVT